MLFVLQFMLPCRAGVAGATKTFCRPGSGEAPGHGVLAAAGTDDEEFHGAFPGAHPFLEPAAVTRSHGAADGCPTGRAANEVTDHIGRCVINGGSGGRR